MSVERLKVPCNKDGSVCGIRKGEKRSEYEE
jgi:hypothetical protein